MCPSIGSYCGRGRNGDNGGVILIKKQVTIFKKTSLSIIFAIIRICIL